MRRINFFLGPKIPILGGGQKVYVDKVYVLCLSVIHVSQECRYEGTLANGESTSSKPRMDNNKTTNLFGQTTKGYEN